MATPIPNETLLDVSPKDDGGLSQSLEGETPTWEIDDSQKEDLECIPRGIYGTPDEIESVRQVCLKHIKVFKRTLNQEPAKLEPFEILIKKDKYEEKLKDIRSQRPRMQSRVKQIDALLLSQVHLTMKPDLSTMYALHISMTLYGVERIFKNF